MEFGDWLPAVAALVGAVVGTLTGAFFSPYFSDRITQLRTWRDRFDEATAAVYTLQSARHGVSLGIPAHYINADGEEQKKFEQQLSKEAVERFVEKAADCRAALAVLVPRCPEVVEFVDRFEIAESDADHVSELLQQARRRLRFSKI